MSILVHFFHISLLSLFSCFIFIHVELFLRWTFFVFHSLPVAPWSSCIISMSQFFHVPFFHVALFLCRTIYMSHFVHVVLIPCCTFFRVAPYCTIFMQPFFAFHPFYVVHFLRVVLFSCSTFFVLHLFCFALISLCFFVLHPLRGASCYTFLMLQFFRAAIFSCFIFFMFVLCRLYFVAESSILDFVVLLAAYLDINCLCMYFMIGVNSLF